MARRKPAARRYAEAAFEVAERDDALEAWRKDLDTAAAVVGQERIGRALANPAIPLETRIATAEATFGRLVGPKVMNLLRLMLRRGRIQELPRLAAEFSRLDDARQGIARASVTSTLPLEPDEVAALKERLASSTDRRVELDLNVDPDLLGGLVVRLGDLLVDGSVRSRLERLRNRLVSGAL
jgi:F-type H+-transporting ATPase subunit delta